MVEENLQTDETSLKDQNEDNPILVAQRYLNIFHQMHIFNAQKKAEFEKSLLEMPERYRDLLPNIPGGRILSEYIEDLENAHNMAHRGKLSHNVSKTMTPLPVEAEAAKDEAVTAAPIIANSTVNLDQNFAKNLASSLATAFKNNNLAPGGNLNELSTVISRSFSDYAQNMQRMTNDILSQNMAQLTKVQNQMQEQMNQQVDWQADFQNKLSSQIDQRLARTQQQMQSQMNNQLNWQSKIQEQLEQNIVQKVQSMALSANNATPAAAQQLNAQTNNANTTTINNVNIDSSCFNNITKAIRETENRRSEDFRKIIEILNKNFSKSINQQSSELPVAAITNSITEALRENSKQQLAAIKAFGETLSQTIRQSQQELAKTLGKSFSEAGERQQRDTAVLPISEKTVAENVAQRHDDKRENQQTKKNKNTQKSNTHENKQETNSENGKQNESSVAKKTGNQNESVPNLSPTKDDTPDTKKENEDFDFLNVFTNKNETDKDDSLLTDFTTTPEADVDLAKILAEVSEPREEKKKKPDVKPTVTDNKTKVQSAPVQPKVETIAPKKVENAAPPAQPKPKPKPSPQTHFYDDAMQKIKAALQSNETVALNDLDAVAPVSLSGEPIEDEKPAFVDTPLDDDLWSEFAIEDKSEPAEDNDDDWEYVDENGNPVTANDDDDWEYVDENGNPVTASDDDDWEYVDENGNPVTASDDGDWEYVDEDGNPVTASDDDDWEYVDENGNPVTANDDNDWEYVDEDGKPVVAENDDSIEVKPAEQITDDDIMSAFAETADK